MSGDNYDDDKSSFSAADFSENDDPEELAWDEPQGRVSAGGERRSEPPLLLPFDDNFPGTSSRRQAARRVQRDDNWKKNPRFIALLLSSIVVVTLFFAALWVPAPYVIESPGPVFNVLGPAPQRGRLLSEEEKNNDNSDNPIISIEGRRTFPVTGRLDMTTVSVRGGPLRPVNIFEVVAAWFDPNKAVIPQEQMYPPGSDGKEEEKQNSLAFSSSQDLAVAAALKELGIEYASEVHVGSVLSGAAKGILKIEDRIIAIDDVEVSTPAEMVAVLAGTQPPVDEKARESPGPGRPVKVTYRRSGERQDVRITPQFTPYEGRSRAGYKLGIALSTRFLFPFTVKFNAEGIGGPSAGMMFALSVVDKLTSEDLAAGRHIAGTGTIDSEGQVGPIGGIKQKMIAAKNSGAALFLAPAGNCDEVVGNIPKGLDVVKVGTLHEALELIGKTGDDTTDPQTLPRCS